MTCVSTVAHHCGQLSDSFRTSGERRARVANVWPRDDPLTLNTACTRLTSNDNAQVSALGHLDTPIRNCLSAVS